MNLLRRLLSVPVALVATGTALAFAAPASAAPTSSCADGKGVIVVVDFDELGGGITRGCAIDGGNAAANFTESGYPLTMVNGDPGFVCRVAGKPSADQESCADTPPATAYWALYWSDGKSGKWTYASLGATGLKVPAGGYVGFAWHQGGGRALPPGVSPTARVATSTPTPTSGAGAGTTASNGSSGSTGSNGSSGSGASTGKGGATTSGTAKASKAPSRTPSASASASAASPSASASAASNASASAAAVVDPSGSPAASASSSPTSVDDLPEVERTAATPADDGGGLPLWAGALIGVGVVAAAVAVPLLRRRAQRAG